MKILQLKKEWPGEWRIMPFGLDSNLFWLSPREWPDGWWFRWQTITTPEKIVWCIRIFGLDYKLARNVNRHSNDKLSDSRRQLP